MLDQENEMTGENRYKGFERLVGKVVDEVRVNQAKDELLFVLESGERVGFQAVGGCCSNSWFEHMASVEVLIGQPVLKVVERKMPNDLRDGNDEKGEHHECLSYYGWTLETPRGRCDVEMRNSSNGYYGGSVEGAVLDETKTTAVTQDF